MAHDLGQIVNALGCKADDLAGDTIVTDVVVLCRTLRADGTTSLHMSQSEGLDWMARFAMVRTAWTREDEALRQHNRQR